MILWETLKHYAPKMFAVGSANYGTPNLGTSEFKIQAGTSVVTTSGSQATITFPTAFTTGVLSIVACEGDSTTEAVGAIPVKVMQSTISKNSFVIRTVGFNGAVRINWIAIGW